MPFIAVALILSQIFLPVAKANEQAAAHFKIQQQAAFAQNTLGNYLAQDSADTFEKGSTKKKFNRWVRRLNSAIQQISEDKMSTDQKLKLKSEVPVLAKELAKKGGKQRVLKSIFQGMKRASTQSDPWDYEFALGDILVPALAIIANGSLIAGIILCALGLFPIGLSLIGAWAVIQIVGIAAMEPEDFLWFNPVTVVFMLMYGGGC